MEKVVDLAFVIKSLLLIVLVALIKYVFFKKKKKILVGYVKDIRVYPVKSIFHTTLQEANVTKLGLKHDRQFVLVNEHGSYVKLSSNPQFVLVKAEIKDDCIELNAEGMESLKLPLEMKESDGKFLQQVEILQLKTKGVHVSKEADEWFQKALGLPGVQLLCYPSDGVPRFVNKSKVLQEDYVSDPLMFSNGCPLMITSESSIEDVNSKSENHVTAERFRPNLIIGGCKPFEEDTWGTIQIGDGSLIHSLYPCQRCPSINIDSQKGVVDKSKKLLLEEMKKIRITPEKYNGALRPKIPIMGYLYGVSKTGVIKVGDPVYHILND